LGERSRGGDFRVVKRGTKFTQVQKQKGAKIEWGAGLRVCLNRRMGPHPWRFAKGGGHSASSFLRQDKPNQKGGNQLDQRRIVKEKKMIAITKTKGASRNPQIKKKKKKVNHDSSEFQCWWERFKGRVKGGSEEV